MLDYEVFQDELRLNFGPYNATGTAEHDLENLWMFDHHRIMKYITQFNRLATQVRWGTTALRYQFYKGLLKDRISEVGKPGTLVDLRDLAQALDHCYWERKTKLVRESGCGNKSSLKSLSDSKSSAPKSTNNSSSSSSSSTPKPQQLSNAKTQSKTLAKPYSNKVDAGRATAPFQQQALPFLRQRRSYRG